MAPWLVRNWVQIGAPVVTTSNGFNWAAMHSPAAQRRSAFVDPVYDPAFAAYRLDQFDELRWNSALQRLGTSNLWHHPTYVVDVAVRNLAAMTEVKPSFNTGAEREDGRDLRVVDATLWIFWLELLAGVAGLWLLRDLAIVRMVALVAGYFAVASLLFIAAPRLRAPMDLALGIGVGCLVEVLARRRSARSLPGRSLPAPT